ncbi:sensor domain-containing diguanylate cyclase [Salisediminibacterium halotolerans]|uniref:sensor domain-containing diguanylate cyclase n=1 Tax=Salisediminibacterium halotolerans TaxID=517425 RepID=UPI000F1ABDAD|nr:sensor domain-containing diguanylate cyclase [Salisediminibacterium halotolerans]RLJ78212.1 sigma-B regulation protein RsbU (phosphoserine phosphatase) [Actinophytocola xinjiangensis]RPE88449.1 sigma-B regulation protein RsbU (phosphoserine phosphatase) [Salisediminibacterium halotolerans]TWG37189.1 sigma-B regulation protein RsbU (phosphoserine phosphatase) [Salisediminibacterium halotolerans]GEL07123.1 hypothetical protein SHA02_05390 [Salisediminibacterium halotolerans]
MDEQLQRAPCAYFVMDKNYIIENFNDAFLKLLNVSAAEIKGKPLYSLLTKSAKVYFQTYFSPIFSMKEQIDEFYTTFETASGPVPAILNAAVHEEKIECAAMEMHVENQYEQEMIAEKKNAERILQNTDEAYTNLLEVMNEYKQKRKELTELNLKLSELSVTDPLTNLKNRRFMDQRMSFILDHAAKENVPFALAMLDIDQFKSINETHGHVIGDDILKQFSNICTSETRSEDLVIRVEGEEFIIVMPSMELEEAAAAVDCIRLKVEETPWNYGDITVSAGVTVYREGDTQESLIQRADKALNMSKDDGQNKVSLHDGETTVPFA